MANEYSADVPKGFNVPKQVRLDSITGIQNEETLKDLGDGNNLAFKYYDGVKIQCKDEKTEYIWREVVGVETGLLDTAFTYPTYPPVDGIDYSGKTYNFFQIPDNIEPVDGSETKLIEGTNVTITGTGTTLDPYEISSSFETSQTYIEEGDNITITGNGIISDPFIVNADLTDLGIVKTIDNEVIAPGQTLSIINDEITGKVLTTKEYVESVIPSTPDGSETKINAGDNITILGTGTTLDPYIINSYTEIPIESDIPALIVNSSYTGVEELGTASKPFKTIQGALDAYVGIGGRGTILDPLDPELLGSIIQIEKGIGTYNFTGDFDYKNLQITLNEGVRISSAPISGWLMDFNLFNTILSHKPIIVFSENAYITCNSNGFKLIGVNLPSTGTSIFKQLSLKGIGEGGVLLNGTAESDILFEVDGTNLQYENSGYSTLEITSRVSINRGRMFVINGKGIVNNKGNFLNILNNINDTITNTYPTVKLSNNAILKLSGSEFWIGETLTVTYSQLIYMDNSAKFEAIDTIFRGSTEYFAYNNTIVNIAEIKLDSCKMYITTNISFAGTISGIWGNIILTNNNMTNTNINSTTTIITPSSINTIGGEIIETLSQYDNRADAILALVPKGGKFINTGGILSPTTGWFIDMVM